MNTMRAVMVIGLFVMMLSACGGNDSSPSRWPWAVRVGPSIVSVHVPDPWANNGGETFTFSAETVGSPVVSWHWNFGGGATPDESVVAQPTVILNNLSTTDNASYVCTLTVTDADGNSDTVQVEYQVGRNYGPGICFADGPTFYGGNPATVTFSIDDQDGDDITVTIELLEGDGVTVEPTSMVVSDYGPYCVTVTNYTADDVEVRLRITLDNGYGETSAEVQGEVGGVLTPEGSICVLPIMASVEVGDVITATVFVREIEHPVAYFDYIALTQCGGLRVLYGSWNLGHPGGDTWEKDGAFWREFPDPIYIPELFLFWVPDAPEWSICADGSNPVGALPGTSGPLFNVQFEAVQPGTWWIDFVPENTHYLEPDGETQHYFTEYFGCEVTVIKAEE